MKKNDLMGAAMIARGMAGRWSDEIVLSRTADDLCRSFGCTPEAAEYILKDELTKRKLNTTKVTKEFE